MKVNLKRRGTQARCAYCLSDVRGEWTCEGCGVQLHEDCASELGRCPTVGCLGVAPARAGRVRSAARAPIQQHRPVARPERLSCAECLQWIGGPTSRCAGCGVHRHRECESRLGCSRQGCAQRRRPQLRPLEERWVRVDPELRRLLLFLVVGACEFAVLGAVVFVVATHRLHLSLGVVLVEFALVLLGAWLLHRYELYEERRLAPSGGGGSTADDLVV